ncbi:MAG: hypothetical protein GY773_18005 [Actinomycetia bacterium]|nr:hypothetical protein [Actinomycetes bacterium]
MATYIYVPPTITKQVRPLLTRGDPASRFPSAFSEVTEGISVLRESGTWSQVPTPTQARLDAADAYYQGGHIYTGVSEATKTEIESDGVGGTFTAEGT